MSACLGYDKAWPCALPWVKPNGGVWGGRQWMKLMDCTKGHSQNARLYWVVIKASFCTHPKQFVWQEKVRKIFPIEKMQPKKKRVHHMEKQRIK
jgi:hypothetical protein